jgi:hypothetical protein
MTSQYVVLRTIYCFVRTINFVHRTVDKIHYQVHFPHFRFAHFFSSLCREKRSVGSILRTLRKPPGKNRFPTLFIRYEEGLYEYIRYETSCFSLLIFDAIFKNEVISQRHGVRVRLPMILAPLGPEITLHNATKPAMLLSKRNLTCFIRNLIPLLQ